MIQHYHLWMVAASVDILPKNGIKNGQSSPVIVGDGPDGYPRGTGKLEFAPQVKSFFIWR